MRSISTIFRIFIRKICMKCNNRDKRKCNRLRTLSAAIVVCHNGAANLANERRGKNVGKFVTLRCAQVRTSSAVDSVNVFVESISAMSCSGVDSCRLSCQLGGTKITGFFLGGCTFGGNLESCKFSFTVWRTTKANCLRFGDDLITWTTSHVRKKRST
jgi:hypothetical protein